MMAYALSFAKFVPGFDFLQGLVKNAGSALPNIGQWVAPTLNPEELDKRIGELRAVQFWLEQNVRMLAATIQALEVQRMTLSTLKTMNVQMDDLRDSLQIRLPTKTASAPPKESAPAEEADAPAEAGNGNAVGAATARGAESSARRPAPGGGATAASSVDPLQWWGALTKQFTELAANAMKETATDAAKASRQRDETSFNAAAEA
jgi:hypothetical protein